MPLPDEMNSAPSESAQDEETAAVSVRRAVSEQVGSQGGNGEKAGMERANADEQEIQQIENFRNHPPRKRRAKRSSESGSTVSQASPPAKALLDLPQPPRWAGNRGAQAKNKPVVYVSIPTEEEKLARRRYRQIQRKLKKQADKIIEKNVRATNSVQAKAAEQEERKARLAARLAARQAAAEERFKQMEELKAQEELKRQHVRKKPLYKQMEKKYQMKEEMKERRKKERYQEQRGKLYHIPVRDLVASESLLGIQEDAGHRFGANDGAAGVRAGRAKPSRPTDDIPPAARPPHRAKGLSKKLLSVERACSPVEFVRHRRLISRGSSPMDPDMMEMFFSVDDVLSELVTEMEMDEVHSAQLQLARDQAATVIQAGMRGMAARKEMSVLREEATLTYWAEHAEEQSRPRGSVGPSAADREEAVVKIQARARGNEARREVRVMREDMAAAHAEMEEAAVKIQAHARGMEARRRVKTVREDTAADEEEVKEGAAEAPRGQTASEARMEGAAVTIQARARGNAARGHARAMREDSAAADAEMEEDGEAGEIQVRTPGMRVEWRGPSPGCARRGDV
ncbi:hypothetical protein CYMTET_20085 [Cymbomonas tetramitiformis]|uniref:Uncharacterized protein n=1 Tax=Cymbomonas tetramitiformis TaxID=36881 RepID=A0AAE0L4I8_9CHLO|nr:hypothetical protein CYMTET_20085 [Cymbomonas tetramitiformis]